MRIKKTFHLTIRMKLLAAFLVFIVLLLFLFSIFSYFRVSDISRTQAQYTARQAFDQAVIFLQYKVANLLRISDVVYFDETLQTILTQEQEPYLEDIYTQTADTRYLDTFLSNLKNDTDVYRASVYFPEWFPYANEGVYFLNIEDLKSTGSYERLMALKDKAYWTGVEQIPNDYLKHDPVNVVSLLRKLRDINSLTEVIGVLRLSVLESTLTEILTNAKGTPNSLVFLYNSYGRVVCSSDQAQAETMITDETLQTQITSASPDWTRIEIGRDVYYAVSQDIGNTDWTIVSIVPNADILSQSTTIRNLLIQIGLWLAAFACIVAVVYSASFVRRIRTLAESMRRVQKGELGVHVQPKGHDEIDELMDTFNYMVDRIQLLLDEQYRSGQHIKSAELKALQAQINPHFLYNSLELIGWKAMEYHADDINTLVSALARFYKLSLNKGSDFVSIQDEIKHVQTYVQIQNMRFEDSIRLNVNIDEDLYQQRVVKIILQPLVENAIFHGFRKDSGKRQGDITITGQRENNAVILLTVRDNGVGMDEEQLKTLLDAPEQDSDHGYGVFNIDQRLKICYGPAFGLTYHLPEEGGVLVEIRIPYQTDL